jgi:hypothetical protein
MADQAALGAIMQIEYFMRTAEYPSEADKSALGTINRPLQLSSLFYECALSAPTSGSRCIAGYSD